MELWEMTFRQYRQHLLENNKYKNTYLNDKKLWNNKEQSQLITWELLLLERAKIGIVPSYVIMSYIREYGEKRLFARFRGIHSLGIMNFRMSQSVRDLRN